MAWWLWVVMGLALLAAETALPGGFFAVFFGFGALAVGALTALGLAGPAWMQWLLFSLLSVVSLLLLRGTLVRRLGGSAPSRPVDSLVGERGKITDDVVAGGVGRVEVRGAAWSARTSGTTVLSRGQRCVVERVEGLTLWVRSE